jgi:hypothetical protein
MNEIKKELERNDKLRNLISKELDIDKKKFAKEVRESIGKEIVTELVENKKPKKVSFWEKIKLLFG